MNVIGHRWHRCDRFSQIVANYQLSVSIGIVGIVGVISGQFFMFIFVVSENNIIFALNSVATAVVWGRILPKKVLLKLSSMFKLRNFDLGMKMIAIAPHRWYVQPLLAICITFGVGYCFIHSKGSAKTWTSDKANKFPHLYFIPTGFFRELGGEKNTNVLI